jgi:hypothetical protein
MMIATADEEQFVELAHSRIWREPGLIGIRNAPGAEIGLAEAQACLAVVRRLAAGGRAKLLVDGSGCAGMSREARRFFAGEQAAAVIRAQAIVSRGAVGRMIGNFFLGLNKPPFPTRIFEDEAEARRWLERSEA